MPTKFDFVSPGVQLREVDESQLPPSQEADGIVLIGRAKTGPAMKPIKVKNLNDFIDTFGTPIDGVRQDDPWREGNTAAPNYAAYAAQAYLAAGVGPVKYIRLLGIEKTGATGASKAGWTMGATPSATVGANAAAYGLFLSPSGSNIAEKNATLGAVFYVSGAALALSGTVPSASYAGYSSTAISASMVVISNANDCGFTIALSQSSGQTLHSVNFNDTSPNYIRSVFNTDPTMYKAGTNYNQSSLNQPYFLGETFDVNINRDISDQSTGKVYGFIMALKNNTTGLDDYNQELTAAKTGWFIGAQTSQKYLFRLIALNDGEEFQNKFYCRIKDIKLATASSPEATFTLEVVKRGSNTNQDIVVEQYTSLSLSSTSPNYISKRIGDYNESWNKTQERIVVSGVYPNKSNYVRVEVASNLIKSDVPFGFLGPKQALSDTRISSSDTGATAAWATGKNGIGYGNIEGRTLSGLDRSYAVTIRWPEFGLTTSGTKMGGNYSYSDYFGLRHTLSTRSRHDASFQDIARLRSAIDPHMAEGAALTGASFVFTLDDISSGSAGSTDYIFNSGSYTRDTSISKLLGASNLIDTKKIKQFSAPFFGGADGVDIRYADPFSNARIATSADAYPQYSVDQALEMIRYQDNIRYELVSMPGIVNSTLQDKMIDIAETRGDALAVVDINGIARDTWDMEGAAQTANLDTVVSQLNTRMIDSSYACTYFPNVRLRDTLSAGESVLVAPPSVAAIGAIAKSEDASQPWFAPAGFNRGGLARLGGNSGPQVLGSSLHVTKADRDILYSNNINPIARFPSTGDTVIFGQKTLQTSVRSALDRINVRRLMIYLKRQIGIISDTILFDQNVSVTWNRFKARANAVLSVVQAELGITEYKLVLDETTTTADLQDQNIMYAKIFVKPARSIEFIAIDFIITRSGVEF